MSEEKGKSFRDVVHAGLWLGDFDGLCNPALECGCRLDDLCPCGEPHMTECVPGFLGPNGLVFPTREAASEVEVEA